MRMLWMIGVLACTPAAEEEKVASGLACANSSDCLEGELCVEQSCQVVDCATSLDCELEEYCTADYECISGCNDDKDCFAGDSCNTDSNECESYGCRETTLDCDVGEFCNPMTAECFSDSRTHCEDCVWNDLLNGNPNYTCVRLDDGSGSCSVNLDGTQTGCSNGDMCYPNDPYNIYTTNNPGTCIPFYQMYTCDLDSTQEQCPNGYSCVDIGSENDPLPVCLGACDLYQEIGLVESN